MAVDREEWAPIIKEAKLSDGLTGKEGGCE